jgi:hypothetical protein
MPRTPSRLAMTKRAKRRAKIATTIQRQEKRIQELEQVLRRVFPEIKPMPPTLSNYKFLSVTITVADLRAVEAVLNKAQD